MSIMAKYYGTNGNLLVIHKTRNGSLIGELYSSGVYKRGNWSRRAVFSGEEAYEVRVMEYFGFC